MTRATTPREGFTTGSAVAAAASAALSVLLTGRPCDRVSIPLPPDENGNAAAGRLAVPVGFCERLEEGGALLGYAGVIKDAGDDPDVTDGMLLTVHAAKDASHFSPLVPASRATLALPHGVTLHAGPGIGIATLPGLPVPVGQMAVNPAPQRQITAALHEAAAGWGYHGPVHCRLAALDGEERARRTLNPRLGITGGISILGTSGTVKPFSAEAWQRSISQALDVAGCLGCATVCLTTGRRSEKAMRSLFPDLLPQAFVQVADYAGFALAAAAERDFSGILWGCFPGKLLKLAQGLAWTHAHAASTDLDLFGQFCRRAGLPERELAEAMRSPTITGALETIRAGRPDAHAAIVRMMAESALRAVHAMASARGRQPEISLYAFDMRGDLLATVRE